MAKNILDRLNASVNGTNRFISSSIGFNQPLNHYNERSIQIVSEVVVTEVASQLVHEILREIPAPKAKDFESFKSGLHQLFSSKEVILGAPEFCEQTVEKTSALLRRLYESQRPLVFTLLGYPNKMPNPLYTMSTGVDLGEVVSLMKLSRLMERVSSIYPFGVKLKILTENTIFYKMSGLSDWEQHEYFLDLCRWAKIVDPKGFIDVEDIVAYHTPELEKIWKEVTTELTNRYYEGEREAVDMVESVMPTNFMTLFYRDLPREILVKVFDRSCSDASIEALRASKYDKALRESFSYLAYHQARYRIGYMDHTFPDSLRLTVAPKVGSFGVSMLNASAKMLPYYGYIVRRNSTFDFCYLVDVPASATAVFQEGRFAYPMYYEV